MAQKAQGWFLGMLILAGIGCNGDKLAISDPATDGEKLQLRLREVLLQAASGQEAVLRCNALESLALLKVDAEVQKVALKTSASAIGIILSRELRESHETRSNGYRPLGCPDRPKRGQAP